ncbi:MAG: cytochrome c oxidase subunit II, partial [Myxococcota bacterium]
MTEPQGTIQLPPQLSTIAPEVDAMYYAIYWISVAFAVAIFVAMGYFLVKYKREPGRKAVPTGHNTFIEVFWTFTPVLLLLWLFIEGFNGYVKMSVAPEDSVEVRVRGMQWNWEFEHAGGVIDDLNKMKVPVDTPVKLIMSSSDVLHSFFVPGFRVKRDVVPGMYTTLWFEGTTQTAEVACESDNDCP